MRNLNDLQDKLGRLRRARDPVTRDRLLVELIAGVLPVLRAERTANARGAVNSGMTAAEFARRIGVTRGAVDHLLHAETRRSRGGRSTSAEVDA